VVEGNILGVERGVHPLHREAAAGLEELALFLLLGDERLHLVGLVVGEVLGELGRVRGIELGHVQFPFTTPARSCSPAAYGVVRRSARISASSATRPALAARKRMRSSSSAVLSMRNAAILRLRARPASEAWR